MHGEGIERRKTPAAPRRQHEVVGTSSAGKTEDCDCDRRSRKLGRGPDDDETNGFELSMFLRSPCDVADEKVGKIWGVNTRLLVATVVESHCSCGMRAVARSVDGMAKIPGTSQGPVSGRNGDRPSQINRMARGSPDYRIK